MHARYFSAHLGRFMSPEPAKIAWRGLPQSWNRYSYVMGRPVIATDPDGRFIHIVVGGVVGGAVGAGAQAIKNRIAGRPLGEGVWAAAGVGAAAGAVGAATFGLGTAVLGTEVGASLISGAAGGAAGGFIQGAGNERFVEGNRNTGQILQAGYSSAGAGAVVGGAFGVLASPFADAITPLDSFKVGLFSALSAETSALVDVGTTTWEVVQGPKGLVGTLTLRLQWVTDPSGVRSVSARTFSDSLSRSLHTFGDSSSVHDLFNSGGACIDGVCVPRY